MEGKELGWSAELTLRSQGPGEGAVIFNLRYENTTADVIKGVQNKLALMAIEANTKGLK